MSFKDEVNLLLDQWTELRLSLAQEKAILRQEADRVQEQKCKAKEMALRLAGSESQSMSEEA